MKWKRFLRHEYSTFNWETFSQEWFNFSEECGVFSISHFTATDKKKTYTNERNFFLLSGTLDKHLTCKRSHVVFTLLWDYVSPHFSPFEVPGWLSFQRENLSSLFAANVKVVKMQKLRRRQEKISVEWLIRAIRLIHEISRERRESLWNYPTN